MLVEVLLRRGLPKAQRSWTSRSYRCPLQSRRYSIDYYAQRLRSTAYVATIAKAAAKGTFLTAPGLSSAAVQRWQRSEATFTGRRQFEQRVRAMASSGGLDGSGVGPTASRQGITRSAPRFSDRRQRPGERRQIAPLLGSMAARSMIPSPGAGLRVERWGGSSKGERGEAAPPARCDFAVRLARPCGGYADSRCKTFDGWRVPPLDHRGGPRSEERRGGCDTWENRSRPKGGNQCVPS